MAGNLAFIYMLVIYCVITFGVAVLAWSRGYNTAKKELQSMRRHPGYLRAVKWLLNQSQVSGAITAKHNGAELKTFGMTGLWLRPVLLSPALTLKVMGKSGTTAKLTF